MTPDDAWEHASNFSTLGDWLKVHEGWRCDLPDELEVGTTLVGVAGVKGMRNRVTWTVKELDAPNLLSVTGKGVGGTKYGLHMRRWVPQTRRRARVITSYSLAPVSCRATISSACSRRSTAPRRAEVCARVCAWPAAWREWEVTQPISTFHRLAWCQCRNR